MVKRQEFGVMLKCVYWLAAGIRTVPLPQNIALTGGYLVYKAGVMRQPKDTWASLRLPDTPGKRNELLL